MEKWTFPLPPESISNPGLKLGVQGFPRVWLGAGAEKRRSGRRERSGGWRPKPRAREFAPLRAATFVLRSRRRAAAGRQCARAGGAGAGRAAGSGTAPRRPGPLHPGTAELASCRGTTLPRPSEIQARAPQEI